TRYQPVLEIRDLRSRSIAGEHNLFMPVEKGVEGVEKFFLRTLLPAEKLNIVDQEQIGLAITFSELDQVVVLDRIDELVDEKLAREIHHLHAFLFDHDVLADGLHEMRLAQAHAAINKQRVVSSGR